MPKYIISLEKFDEQLDREIGLEELVMCKDCKYRMLNDDKDFSVEWYCDLDTNDFYAMGRNAYDENWFCADGERKEDAETKTDRNGFVK